MADIKLAVLLQEQALEKVFALMVLMFATWVFVTLFRRITRNQERRRVLPVEHEHLLFPIPEVGEPAEDANTIVS